jgi:hypothetical protein
VNETSNLLASHPEADVAGSGYTRSNRDKAMPEVLDDVLARTDAKRPIAIFGYRMMSRGTSFRPTKDAPKEHQRVPTHIILWMGKGMSIDKVVQAFGRATFTTNGATKPIVKVLARKIDFETARLYPRLMREVARLMKEEKKTLSEIFTQDGPLSVIKDEDSGKPLFEIFLELDRKVGQEKRGAIDAAMYGLVPAVPRHIEELIPKLRCLTRINSFGYASASDIQRELREEHNENVSSFWSTLTRSSSGHLMAVSECRRLFQIRGVNETTSKKKTIQALLSSWRKCETRRDIERDVDVLSEKEFAKWILDHNVSKQYSGFVRDSKELYELFSPAEGDDGMWLRADCLRFRVWKFMCENKSFGQRAGLIVVIALRLFESEKAIKKKPVSAKTEGEILRSTDIDWSDKDLKEWAQLVTEVVNEDDVLQKIYEECEGQAQGTTGLQEPIARTNDTNLEVVTSLLECGGDVDTRALDDEQKLLEIFRYVKDTWSDKLGDKMERLLDLYDKGANALPYMVVPPTSIRPDIIECIKEKVGNINYLWDKYRRLAMVSNRTSKGLDSLQFFVYPRGDVWMGRLKEFVLSNNDDHQRDEELSEIYEEQKITFDHMNRKGKKQMFKTDDNFPWGIRCSKIDENAKEVQKTHISCERCFNQIVCMLRAHMLDSTPIIEEARVAEEVRAAEEARAKADAEHKAIE